MNEHSPEYLASINSPRWKELSKAVRAAGRCAGCETFVGSNALQAHHLHYETLGEEDECDLLALCERCHDIADGRRSVIIKAIDRLEAVAGLGIGRTALFHFIAPRLLSVMCPRPSPVVRQVLRPRGQGAGLEERLLRAMLAAPACLARARQEVPPDTFEVPAYREIFERLLGLSGNVHPHSVGELVSPRAKEAVQRLSFQVSAGKAAGTDFYAEYVEALHVLSSRSLIRQLVAGVSLPGDTTK